MANEITVSSTLRVTKGDLDYQSRPTSLKADLTTARPPGPGLVYCPSNIVTVVSFANLANPGWCRIQNLGDDAGLSQYIDVGMYDSTNLIFLPMLELLNGDSYCVRLSRNLGEVDSVPAPTGTSVYTRASLAILSLGYNIKALVEAFDMD